MRWRRLITLRRVLLLASGGILLWLLLTTISVYTFSRQDQVRHADAAIVLGAAVFRDRPSPILRERINHAISLYQQGWVDTLIFTGGVGRNDEASEAEVAAQYALDRGVPPEAILLETTSTSTLENLANAQELAESHSLETFLIISTPYHMKRAMAIASDLGMEAYSSPTQTTRWISTRTESYFFMREVAALLNYTFFKA